MAQHQVVFRINALVGINVEAGDFKEAIELAKKRMDKKGMPFKDELEYIDGKERVVAVNNIDGWNLDGDE